MVGLSQIRSLSNSYLVQRAQSSNYWYKILQMPLFSVWLRLYVCFYSGEGPQAHLKKLAECIRWSYGLGIVLRLGNIARLELNYCIPMGVQSGDR